MKNKSKSSEGKGIKEKEKYIDKMYSEFHDKFMTTSNIRYTHCNFWHTKDFFSDMLDRKIVNEEKLFEIVKEHFVVNRNMIIDFETRDCTLWLIKHIKKYNNL